MRVTRGACRRSAGSRDPAGASRFAIPPLRAQSTPLSPYERLPTEYSDAGNVRGSGSACSKQ
eukprot:7378773-Prymnesium_polylepis.1